MGLVNGTKSSEGFAEFSVPDANKPCKTWYQIHGNLKSATHTPLIIVHGGPGMGHNYLRSMTDLATEYSIPLVFYDQLGCGNSTHMPEKRGVGDFWTPSLFLDELDNLLNHLGLEEYDVFGNSWGGMLAAMHGIRKPKGLRKLIIANSPTNIDTWVSEADKLRNQLPLDVQSTLKKHEESGAVDSPEYEEAVMEFYRRHVCRVDPWPSDVIATLENVKADDTVYHTMNGPSEFHVIGTLRHLDITNEIHKIDVPTMILNGRFDEATDVAVEPFFHHLQKVKWVSFAESSHMPNWEEREHFMRVVAGFLGS